MVQDLSRSAATSIPSDAIRHRPASLLDGTRLHAGFLLALFLAVVLWFVFSRTLWGFRLRAVGVGPRAAEVSGGVDSQKMGAVALFLSAAMAGLAGGVEVSGVSHALFQNLSPGYGFTGIAVALLGGLHPIGVVFAGILFGALEAGAGAMQRERSARCRRIRRRGSDYHRRPAGHCPKGGWSGVRIIRRTRPAANRAAG